MLSDPDEAQDVAQETFLRLWQRGPALDQVEHATAWAYRTSTRLAVDRLRRRATAARLAMSPGEAPSPESALGARQLIGLLARSVAADCLEAAILERVDGLAQAETAEVLGVSERTVRRLLARFDAAVAQHRGATP